MPLPAGFKVGGVSDHSKVQLPPKVKQVIELLDKLPKAELIISQELYIRIGSTSGSTYGHFGLADYRQKVDNKLYWGSKKSIAQLREQLSQPEDSDDQN